MDAPTLRWLHKNITPTDVAERRVLEVGSMNVNGSIRPHIQSLECREYVGVDIAARHSYPHDHWRFTPRILRAAFADFSVKICRAVAGKGVVLKAVKPDPLSVEAVPAPNRDPGWLEWRVWVFWAYRGRKPGSENVKRKAEVRLR